VCEENILQSWQQLLAKYLFFMPKTFRDIDPATLARRDAPAGFRVFREAAMNLLIHQDYGDHSRKAVIQFFTDGIQFWNPGDSFSGNERLLEPGEKEVRNPAIAMALRRIEMCEQAGTGLRMMRREWQALGHAAPTHRDDQARKAFETFLPDTMSRMAWMGERATAPEGAPHHNTPPVTPPATPPVAMLLDLLAKAGELGNAEIRKQMQLKDRVHVREHYIEPALAQALIEYTLPDKPRSRSQKYRLTEAGQRLQAAMSKRHGESAAVLHVTPPVTPPVAMLLDLLAKAGELGNAEIREQMQLRDRVHVREHYIEPALAQALIEYTLPEQPRSRLQKYRLTEAGQRLQAAMKQRHKELNHE